MKWLSFFGIFFIVSLILRVPIPLLLPLTHLPVTAQVQGDLFHGSLEDVPLKELDFTSVFNPETVISVSWDFLRVTWSGIEYSVELEAPASQTRMSGFFTFGVYGAFLTGVKAQSGWMLLSDSWRADLLDPKGQVMAVFDLITLSEMNLNGTLFWEDASILFYDTRVHLGRISSRVMEVEESVQLSFDNQARWIQVKGQARLKPIDPESLSYTLEVLLRPTDQTPEALRLVVLPLVGTKQGDGRKIMLSGVLTEDGVR